MQQSATAAERLDWVDAAKGLCIIFVVMMHSTLGVELATGQQGFMHWLVAFARPFRMPDFFLISGLFLGLVIDRPWRRYLDRKVVHFLYFYVLWFAIQLAFKAPGMIAEGGIGAAVEVALTGLVQPFGTLWFIYILPIFFLFTRLVRNLPVWLVLAWAALLEILPVHTGILLFDEFCARYVYFFAGYALAARIFDVAAWVAANTRLTLGLLLAWALVNAGFVFTPAPSNLAAFLQPESGFTGQTGGLSELPLLSLLLGIAGALAIVAVSALLNLRAAFGWLRWLGARSIVVYLAFFLPMAVTREVLLRTGLIPDVGLVSLIVTVAGVAGPLVLYGMIQLTGRGRFLFERPRWAHIDRAPLSGRDRASITP